MHVCTHSDSFVLRTAIPAFRSRSRCWEWSCPRPWDRSIDHDNNMSVWVRGSKTMIHVRTQTYQIHTCTHAYMQMHTYIIHISTEWFWDFVLRFHLGQMGQTIVHHLEHHMRVGPKIAVPRLKRSILRAGEGSRDDIYYGDRDLNFNIALQLTCVVASLSTPAQFTKMSNPV